MSQPEVVIALYRPKSGRQAELDVLVQKHFPVLQEYGLTTDRRPFVGRAEDGTVIEIFEWASREKAKHRSVDLQARSSGRHFMRKVGSSPST